MSEYKHAALVRKIVDSCPPLTPEQRARIRILMRGSTALTGRWAALKEEEGK